VAIVNEERLRQPGDEVSGRRGRSEGQPSPESAEDHNVQRKEYRAFIEEGVCPDLKEEEKRGAGRLNLKGRAVRRD